MKYEKHVACFEIFHILIHGILIYARRKVLQSNETNHIQILNVLLLRTRKYKYELINIDQACKINVN